MRGSDRRVLTRPVGSGVAAQAIEKDALAPEQIDLVVRMLSTLNRCARDAALDVGEPGRIELVRGQLLAAHTYRREEWKRGSGAG